MTTRPIKARQSFGTISSQKTAKTAKTALSPLSSPSISKSIFENVTLENIYHAIKYLPKDALLACDRFFKYRSNSLSAADDSINSQKKSIFHVAIEYLYPATMLQEAIDKVLEDWQKSPVVLSPGQENGRIDNPQMEHHKELLSQLKKAQNSQTSTYSPPMDYSDLGVFRATHTLSSNKSNEKGFYETILDDVEAYKKALQEKFASTNTDAATNTLAEQDKEKNLKLLLRRIPEAVREKITFDPASSSSPNTTR